MKHAIFAAVLFSPAPVSAGYAVLYEVHPLDGDAFEVIATQGPASGDFWCGAAQYALADLGKGATQRIYVTRGRGPSVKKGDKQAVQFTFSPPASGAVESQSISVDIVGNGMSAAQAQAFCFDRTIKD